MKLKSLLFGSAAVLMTVGGAQAADLAVAAPVSYVKVCDAFGSGYYYAPGTQTCLKIGGYVRFDVKLYENTGGVSSTTADDHQFRTGINFNVTAKSMTEMGPLTGYIAFDLDGSYTGTGEKNINLDKAYLEWGPLLAGHTTSITGVGKNPSLNGSIDNGHLHADVIQLTFGASGMTFQVALEDYRDHATNFPTGKMPDITGAITGKFGDLELKVSGGYGDRISGGTYGVAGHAILGLNALAKGDYIAVWGAYSQNSADWAQNFASTASTTYGGTGSTGNWTLIGGSALHNFTPKFSLAVSGSRLSGPAGNHVRGMVTAGVALATNLKFSAEYAYQKSTGTHLGAAAAEGNMGLFRIERSFP